MTFKSYLLAFGLAAATPLLPANEAETRMLRFPTTNGENIVFSYAGQLYTVPSAGGTARRLTDGPGYAIFPRFSPDGKTLAFTAQYDGNTEVYQMPAAGGAPVRLTYSATLGRDDLADRMGPNNIVMTWRNTKPEIVFRSRWRTFNPFIGELYSVGLDAEVPAQLPVPRGGFVSFSPDDNRIAYNRIFREFRTWKNYRGGMADDIWIFDLKSGALENITQNDAQDLFPMWAPNGKIYFVSERTGRGNLFSYDLATKATTQVTRFTDYDVKFPSLGRGAVVFEQAGQIWRLDLATERSAPVPIRVQEDFAAARPVRTSVARWIQGVSLAPDAQRVVVVARGEVFSVPAKQGAVRNLTQTPGVHERGATWSPDGKWIAYLSDATGEFELYVRSQDGRSEPVALTSGADTYPFNPKWSPDSKRLAWSDRKGRLRSIEVESKSIFLVATHTESLIRDFSWSPDSKWIAWTRGSNRGTARILLTQLADGTTIEATDGWYDANNPQFSDDGKWLTFASARDFNPIYSDTEWNHAYQNMERIYLLALAKDTPSPFAPKSDEVNLGKEADPESTAKPKESAEGSDKKPAGEKPGSVKVVIDAEGLSQRLVGLPIPPSGYSTPRMVGDKVYYRRVPGGPVTGGGGGEGFGAGAQSRSIIAVYHLKDRKETELGNADGFEISANGKKMLLRVGRDWSLIDTPSAKFELKPEHRLDLSGLEAVIDRRAEWAQVFHESWRQMRDFFYDPNLHGVDWPAQRAKYAALLPHVANRNDLTYLIGEMVSELHVGHAYVSSGDRIEAPRIQTGLLGAQVSRDPASRAYRIDRILAGENWQSKTRSPLTEMGVNVAVGDYILAVDGRPVAQLPNLYAALVGTVGKQVVLRVNGQPTMEGARDVTVVPIANEAPLYYEAWVSRNIARVAERSGGKAGYLHIPDMGPEGLNEFVRRFYPQLNKEALVIDVRGNGGGNVSPMIIERLRREVAMINLSRGGVPSPNPTHQLTGPKVTLINEYSASDGDLFPYRFRATGLGLLVGKRTWGGTVGITGTLPFVDGGELTRPEFAHYAADGSSWIIEGHGVEPDLFVDNDPSREFRGEDQQLDKAIDVVVEALKAKPSTLPPPPPYPIKK
ncbi:MAG TPA: PDZ domain-containing protein [Opitutaceae bacterium]|nr:PDZ domain-containing protein [Opitutaceae bacterium]